MLTNYLSLIRSVATFDHWYFGIIIWTRISTANFPVSITAL